MFRCAWIIRVLIIFLIIGPATSIGAKLKNDAKLTNFNSKAAFSQLNSIKKQIGSKPDDLETVKLAANKIEKLQNQAEICIEKADAQLAILNDVLKSLESIDIQTNIQKKDEFKYFKTKKDGYTQQIITCRLFLFQSQEILTELKENIQKITTQIKLQRATPIWQVLGMTPKAFIGFDSQKFYKASGFPAFTTTSSTILLAIIIISLLLTVFIRKKYSESKYSGAFATVIKKYVTPLLLLGSISGYLAIMFISTEPQPLIENISYILLTYVVALSILDFGSLLTTKHKTLLALLTAITIIVIIFSNQAAFFQLKYSAISFFYLLLSTLVIWKSWPTISLVISTKLHKQAPNIIKIILIGVSLGTFLVQALGYYQLALHIIFGFLLIVSASVLFYLTIKMVNAVEKFLHNREGKLSKTIRQNLGLKYSQKITEFIFIKISVYLLATYGFALALLGVFGASLSHIDQLNKSFMDGFVLVTMKIIPFQIILALFVFGVLLILGRWAINTVTKKGRTQSKRESQDVMASLFSYISFCVAFIIATIIAGIDFTGLAFIVGALSVGIGLGLQNIVNNFISGIILLVEKSIKPGDRVVINDKEGFVKEIRLRSTQITTLAKEDIIVPNSDFITQSVINYTFRDDVTRINCKVGVSYDSDVDLVRKTLFEIAANHPDVVQDESTKPAVLFNEFADSSLNFALYCTINDANKRYKIISDLNTMIFKEFKKRSIEIAYPQLDVHMFEK